jgi:hypothetical protein
MLTTPGGKGLTTSLFLVGFSALDMLETPDRITFFSLRVDHSKNRFDMVV